MSTIWGDRVAEINLELYRGEDFRYAIDFKQPNNQPLDLTGCSVIAKIHRHFTDEVATFAVEISDPISGQLILVLSSVQLPPAAYSWNLFLVNSAGNREPKITGLVTVYG
jgi:hypothetical protein